MSNKTAYEITEESKDLFIEMSQLFYKLDILYKDCEETLSEMSKDWDNFSEQQEEHYDWISDIYSDLQGSKDYLSDAKDYIEEAKDYLEKSCSMLKKIPGERQGRL